MGSPEKLTPSNCFAASAAACAARAAFPSEATLSSWGAAELRAYADFRDGYLAGAVAELARRFKNDQTLAFGCVGAARQDEFLKGLSLEATGLPALLAVKGAGKRPRAARMPPAAGGIDDVAPMAAFVDSVLGGGATFKRLSDGLPELEPPYLMDGEDGGGEEEVRSEEKGDDNDVDEKEEL